jgi:tRNA(Ile)-lysidine synthase TilS/MesJ
MKKFFYSKPQRIYNDVCKTKRVNTIHKFESVLFENSLDLNDKIYSKILSILRESQKTNSNFLLCPISNGQDSIAMLLFSLYYSKNVCFENVYCQHFWQSQNFISTRSIFQLSYWLKIPYRVVLSISKNNTENGSRDWRKKTFSRLSHFEHYFNISTGHSQTDILEKNLHSLLRGTSPRGITNFLFLSSKQVGLFFSMDQPLVKKNKHKSFSFLRFFREKKDFLNYPVKISYSFLYLQKYRRQVFLRDKTSPNFFSMPFSFFNFGKTKMVTKLVDSSERKIFFEAQNIFKNRNSSSFLFSSEFNKRNIVLLKPLKNLSRFQISQMLKMYYLPLIIDITNFSLVFCRNKIRHQLVPFLRSLIQQNLEIVMIHFFKLLEKEQKNTGYLAHKNFFLFRILNTACTKKKLFSFDSLSHLVSNRNDKQTKLFFKNISKRIGMNMVHDLFLDYKNRSLTYLQIVKLENFINNKEK